MGDSDSRTCQGENDKSADGNKPGGNDAVGVTPPSEKPPHGEQSYEVMGTKRTGRFARPGHLLVGVHRSKVVG